MDKRKLSRPTQWLFDQAQTLNFGKLTFFVRDGEPDLARPYRTARTVKVTGGDNGPRPEAASAGFELRKEHVALLAGLARLPNGSCVSVKFMHGLPGSSFDIEEEHLPA